MDKKKPIGAFVIASAIIWGGVILGVAFALAGTGCYPKIQIILAMGFIAHFFFVWVPLVAALKAKKDKTE